MSAIVPQFLFLGVLPFDRHALALEHATEREGFAEESRWRPS
jgi:hypothetical protein